ncbi:unnamed protein product [Trichobilharzia regenti]|nr:unnamed protein product [Trichobilharzia regenti]
MFTKQSSPRSSNQSSVTRSPSSSSQTSLSRQHMNHISYSGGYSSSKGHTQHHRHPINAQFTMDTMFTLTRDCGDSH